MIKKELEKTAKVAVVCVTAAIALAATWPMVVCALLSKMVRKDYVATADALLQYGIWGTYVWLGAIIIAAGCWLVGLLLKIEVL